LLVELKSTYLKTRNDMSKVRIKFEGPDYYLYTLTSWMREIQDIVRDMTCVDEIEVITEKGEDVKIYVDNDLIFEGLPDAEWALAELLIHELHKRGYKCSEDS